MDRVRTILIESGLPLSLWAEATAYSIYTKNRCPTQAVDGKTPYEVLYGNKPNISHLRAFGSKCFVHNDQPNRSKLDPRAFEAIFIGYSLHSKAWKYYCPETRKSGKSRNVKFDESVGSSVDRLRLEGEVSAAENSNHENFLLPILEMIAPTPNPPPNIQSNTNTLAPAPPENTVPVASAPVAPAPKKRKPPTKAIIPPRDTWRRSKRIAGIPAYPAAASITQTVDARPVETLPPLPDSDGEPELEIESDDDDDEVAQFAYLVDDNAFILSGEEPKSFKEATESPDCLHWESAMDDEINSVTSIGTFDLVKLPPNREAIGSKWVYRLKRDPAGEISRHKARIVALGCAQQPGIDFFDTHAPVAKMDAIRFLLAYAAMCDFEIHQVDVKTAFLNGDLEETIYMRQPKGYVVKGKEDHVWKLNKTLYGLKQAGRVWYHKLRDSLLDIGFKTCTVDPCVFIRYTPNSGSLSIIFAHVDDLGLICNSIAEVNRIKGELSRFFQISDLGEIYHLLGIKIIRNRQKRTLSLSHAHYISSILEKYDYENLNPVSTPLEPGLKLTKTSTTDSNSANSYPYQAVVGSLMHAAVMTRPDISHAVMRVAQFMSDPDLTHWSAVKRILRYLKGTQNFCLTYGRSDNDTVVAYSDADYGNDRDTRRSISGYAFMIGGGCFAWSSKKQATVTLSTAEAEYIAGTSATKEIIWLRTFLREIGLPQQAPSILYVDNASAIAIMNQPDVVNDRSKHIDVRHHWIREMVRTQILQPQHIPTDYNISDIFTKGLHRQRHHDLAARLGLHPDAESH